MQMVKVIIIFSLGLWAQKQSPGKHWVKLSGKPGKLGELGKNQETLGKPYGTPSVKPQTKTAKARKTL